MEEARPTGMEAMEEEGRAGKDSSRVDWGVDHCITMPKGGSVVVEELTEVEGVLEVEAATQGALVEIT